MGTPRAEMEFERRVAMARARFFDGREVPPGLVSEAVVRSWERSLRSGLAISDPTVFDEVSAARRRAVEERNRHLFGFAMPELQRLQAALSRSGWLLACVDTGGSVIASISAPDTHRDLRRVFRPGVDLAERHIGTSAPGCAVLERAPVVVNANEHFLEELKGFSCIAVPIFDPDGELVGALDASCGYRGNPVTAMEPVFIAARSVENRMVHAIPDAIRLGVHYRGDMLGSPLEGVLAFSPEGRLLGMNQVARQLLGLSGGQRGLEFSALFDAGFGHALDVLRRGGAGPVALEDRQGMQLVMQRRDAAPVSVPVRRPASAPEPEVRAGDAVMAQATTLARRAMERDIPILIQGETGTGKDALARMIHAQGARGAGPFVALNCSAIPAGLIESELFGYEDGAFTGGRRGGASGRFEQAQGGTLFLDEIGDMPLELQARLLRVLQERSVTRIGGKRALALDVGVICATHRDLKAQVAQGAFREDLYYRINGLRLTLPPLRTRPDLDALIEHQLVREARGGAPLPVSDAARSALRAYSWPGNIRQLQHVLRLAAMLAEDEGRIDLRHLHEDVLEAVVPDAAAGAAPPAPGPRTGGSLSDAERSAVRAAMERHGGNVSAAARSLGIARETLYRKLRAYGLRGAS